MAYLRRVLGTEPQHCARGSACRTTLFTAGSTLGAKAGLVADEAKMGAAGSLRVHQESGGVEHQATLARPKRCLFPKRLRGAATPRARYRRAMYLCIHVSMYVFWKQLSQQDKSAQRRRLVAPILYGRLEQVHDVGIDRTCISACKVSSIVFCLAALPIVILRLQQQFLTGPSV